MATLAWPLSICSMAVVILIVLALRFPTQIGGLIDRITNIGVSGVTAKPATPVVSQEVKDVTKTAAAEEQLQVFDNQLLIWQEDIIKDVLLKAVETPADRERILVRHLASVFLNFRFESIYNGIWGSQIHALQAVNQSGAVGLPRPILEIWYEIGKADSPARYMGYTYESWVGYLHGSYLVVTNADGNVQITHFGNEFLLYLIRNKYTFYRGG